MPLSDPPASVEKCALVADDDETMRDILYSLLTEAGYKVRLAASGREAISLASDLDASVAIIDLAMRDGNGLQTSLALRRMPRWHHVPIVILTHYPISQALNAALRAGANGFVCKPLVPAELLWCLEAHIAQAADAASGLTIAKGSASEVAMDPAEMPEEALPPAGSKWILGSSFRTLRDRRQERSSDTLSLAPIAIDAQNQPVSTYGSQPRILVREDDPLTRELISQVLNAEGCMVEFGCGGYELLSMFMRSHYDLVLINVGMLSPDRIPTICSLRRLREGTPIVAIVNNTAQLRAVDLADAGVSGMLIEPVTPEILRACLQRHLSVEISDQISAAPNINNRASDLETLSAKAKLFAPGTMDKFLAKLAISIKEILEIIDSGRTMAESPEFLNQLHNLAGTAGTLGCHALSAAARALEADRSDPDMTQQRFTSSCKETLSIIHTYRTTLESSKTTASTSGEPDAEPPLPSALHVLVVDDVAMIRDIAGTFLRTAGHTVTLADGGMQAAKAVEINDFDVVLMDVRMPGVDGLEATRRIRALGDKRGRVPILALTAQIVNEQVAECLDAGMNGHLPKPFDQKTLLTAVIEAAEAGRRRGASSQPDDIN